METALWTSRTGLDAQRMNLDVIANNLANVNTAGFKRARPVFEDLVYLNMSQPGGQTTQTTQSPSGLMVGTGVKTVATEKIHSAGNIIQTNNPLDLAVTGRGFFQIQMPDGSISYTHNGEFQLDSTGNIVNASGYPLTPAVTIPPNSKSITIGRDGIVSVVTAGSSTPQQVGTIQLADFVNPTGLEPVGENLFIESASSGAPVTGEPNNNGFGGLMQSSLESSNVNVVEELVNMIEAQRAYEMNSKAIKTIDSMLQFAEQEL